MMKNTFYVILKAFVVHNLFEFLSLHFGHVEKRLDQKNQVSLKVEDATIWKKKKTISIHNCPISQEVKTIRK